MNQYFLQNEENDFLPIISVEKDQDEDNGKEQIVFPHIIPLLPLRNTVLFPGIVLPISVGRELSIKAVNDVYKKDKLIGVVTQIDANTEEPKIEELSKIGTIAKIIKLIKMPDGGTTVIIQGKEKFCIQELVSQDPYFQVSYTILKDEADTRTDDFRAHIATIKDIAIQIVQLSPHLPSEATTILKNIDDPVFLINFVSSNQSNELNEKQSLLEINSIKERAEKLIHILQRELQFAQLKDKVTNKTKTELDKQQKEFFLHQQMKSIREELGNDNNDKELQELRKKAEKKKWTTTAQQLFEQNIAKLDRMSSNTPDYSILYNHLDFMLQLPWNEYTTDQYELSKAKDILNHDHYGMDKIKNRILEYIAVLKLKGDLTSPILCFVGPPGIGKTSLGKSIANAINRRYIRMSLGGLHDESEIRGHRKTYIGAMPGRILQSLKKVKVNNPVMILDEIDKIGNDYRGDPSSALLEVLDPEQNSQFYDNYLELEYDLSKVLFIATANTLQTLQPALRDRLEIIELNGYAMEEKVEIAKQYLIPKQKDLHGLKDINIKVSDHIIEKVISDYTRESGVRELDRQLSSIMRFYAKEFVTYKKIKHPLNKESLTTILGQEKFNNDEYKLQPIPGVAVGLAWTVVGGDILFIEVLLSEGKGELKLTGNLGNVMKESATTALSFIQANHKKLHIDPALFTTKNIHIHLPEGATPKDGPSAGITLLTALVSAFKGKRIRPYLAMTGEITLRGIVLPVGGVKEKVLAAKRAGLKEVILCWMNEKDIKEINSEFIKGLSFRYVKTMQQVIDYAIP